MPVFRDSTFAQDWNHRELVGYVFDDPRETGSPVLASDRNDDVHWGQEIAYMPHVAETAIGYKRRSHDWYWPYTSPPIVVAGDSASGRGGYPCISAGEALFIQETDTGDTLHMTYGHDVPGGVQDTCSAWRWWVCYTRKALDAPDTAWAAETYVTNRYGTATPSVDGTGTNHFLVEQVTFNGEGRDSLLVWDLRGHPPVQGAWSDTTWVRIASYKWPPNVTEETGDQRDPATVEPFGDYLYATWIGFVPYEDTSVRAVFLARYDVDNQEWSSPVLLSPNNGVESRKNHLVIAPDGAFHLMYVSGPPGVGAPTEQATIYHIYNHGNPLDPAQWSPRTEVSFEHTLAARSPWFAASNDSAWVVYQCGDNGAGGWQVWGQKGHELASSVVASGDSVTWSGAVYLDRDFLVASGGTLTIEPGTRVIAQSNMDSLNVGNDEGKVEIVVEGQLLVNGSADSSVTFTSTGGTPGDWGGILFDLAGCERTGYGYAGCFQPISALDHANIEYGKVGVAIEDYCGPSIENTTFSSILDGRDVYLDGTDVFLPRGYWSTGTCGPDSEWVEAPAQWSLKGGTHVVASTGGVHDGWHGVTGKVDLIVDGDLFTDGSTAAEDTVYFGPETVTDPSSSSAGNDWGGIFLSSYAAGSHLRFADIGYAENPVFIYYPDSLTGIECSRIHHFADTGIWIQGSMGSGGYLDSCVVDRGSDLEPSLGGTGISLDQADKVNVLNSQVRLVGREDVDGATGIEISYGKTLCQTTPLSHRSLLVEHNLVVGPGRDVDTGEDYTGVQTDWVCGSNDRDVDILRNLVAGFKFAGMDFEQTADVQNSCNFLWNNRRGVDVYRDSEPTGTSIRFKENKLQATEQLSTYFALRTTDASKVKLGPSQSDRGQNRLKVNKVDTKFIYEGDSNGSHVLDATYNFWYADTLLADSTQIVSRFAPSGYSINMSPFLTDDSGVPTNCWQDTTFADSLLSGGSSARRGLVAVGDDRALAAPDPGVPTVLELGKPFPNPNSSGATLSLAVPANRTGQYLAQVFDVSGRRVWEGRQVVAHGGRYRLVWEGRDTANLEVATGVYFLRVSGPGGFVETRKITVLR